MVDKKFEAMSQDILKERSKKPIKQNYFGEGCFVGGGIMFLGWVLTTLLR